jgi:hypothetical protein
VVLHPKYAENHFLIAYSKAREDGRSTTALARDGSTGPLTDVEDIFSPTADRSSTNYGGRIAFDRDGM